jgi:hypothetical protein
MKMLIGEIRNLLCGIMLALTFGLTGCMTMPDGSSKPDYVMIEFGAVAAMTVIVNETKVSDEVVVKAYKGLSAMETALLTSGPMDLSMIDTMLANAVPMEYKALATVGSKLIRSRVAQYMEVKLPTNPITENELVMNTTLIVK